MLNHKGTKLLETQRLTLRRFTEDDATAMFEVWANDERVTKYLKWTPHGDVSLTKQLLANWCGGYQNDNCYNW